jgi:hypothetical protein
MDWPGVVKWVSDYKKSWEVLDTDLFVSLFTEDATYQTSPFAEPFHGRDFRTMWNSGRHVQAGNHMNLEVWHVEGDAAIVQWIAHTIYFDKGARHGNGVLRLTFTKDGRCSELREWQHWNDWIRKPGQAQVEA